MAHKKNHSEVKNYIIQHQDKEEISISQIEQDPQPKYNKRQGTSGISGQFYEIELSMLFLLQGITKKEDEKIDNFYLATNMEEAGDFDDVVFKYKYRDQNGVEKLKVTFLQAKHKDNPENAKEKITIDRLLSESSKKETFSLKDYFYSYRKIKEGFLEEKVGHPIFEGKFEDCDFIIYTNALPHRSFNENDKNLEKIDIEQEDILNFWENNHYYKLTLSGDKDVDKKIIDVLQYSSDCKKLAKELVKSIFPNEKQKSAEIVNQGIVKKYHVSLAEKMIKKKRLKEGVLSEGFLDGDESLSLQDRKFRDVFFDEVRKKKEFSEKSMDELKLELRNRNIKLPDNLGNAEEKDSKIPLPSDLVDEEEIKEFLGRLKLFINQPNENKLSEILKEKIQLTYRVEQNDIKTVFSDIKYKVQEWWKDGDEYLTESNRFFQNSIRISIRFDVKEPITLFTGRIKELEDLHKILQKGGKVVISQVASVTGLGGVGKSELARKYISEHSKDYNDNLIWINAESYGTLAEYFRRLAQDKLGISTKNFHEKDIESIVKEVYRFFAKRKALFVFDNAERYRAHREGDEGIDKFLPSGPDKPYVLITSRNQEWGEIKSLPLDVFTEEEAIEFIKKALNIGIELQESEVKELAHTLQYFPLALKQAVAYIKMENKQSKSWNVAAFTIKNYLDQYKREADKLLELKTSLQEEDGDRYTKTALTTWKVTIDKIKQKMCGEQALEILDIMAYFAPSKISIEWIFSKSVSNEEKLHSAVELLDQYSMANLEQGVLNIHRLAQQVTRIELKEQDKEREVLKKALTLLKKTMEGEINAGIQYMFHASSVWSYVSRYSKLIDDFYFDFIYHMGKTPLHLLVEDNNYEATENIILYIEKQHLDKLSEVVNAKDNEGRSPLCLAASKGQLKIVRYLVDKGADLNVASKYDRTPLHWADRYGELEVVKYLIEKGAALNAKNHDGETALHWAAKGGYLEVINLLLGHTADITIKDNSGKIPLDLAKEKLTQDPENDNLKEIVDVLNQKSQQIKSPSNASQSGDQLPGETGNEPRTLLSDTVSKQLAKVRSPGP